jgi:hypothetical protein
MKGLVKIIFAFLFATFFTGVQAQSYKIDTVYFQNGDKVTGELLSLNKGRVQLKTSDAGTLSIKWINIDSLCVLNPMRILKHNGGILYGQLFPSGQRQVSIVLNQNNETQEVELQSISELIQLKKRFIDRVQATLSSGFRYTKATENSQLDFATSAEYKGEKSFVKADYSVVLTHDGTQTTQRQTGGASYNRLLPNNWSLNGRVLGESNSEFKLDLRTSVILGAKLSFISSNKQLLQLGGGVSLNREFSGSLQQNNLEGVFGFNYSIFIVNTPEVTFNSEAYIAPSFTTSRRYRSNINSDLKWELFSDFYLKWNLFFSSDNKPLSGVDVRNDWGASIGIEYKFQ